MTRACGPIALPVFAVTSGGLDPMLSNRTAEDSAGPGTCPASTSTVIQNVVIDSRLRLVPICDHPQGQVPGAVDAGDQQERTRARDGVGGERLFGNQSGAPAHKTGVSDWEMRCGQSSRPREARRNRACAENGLR